MRRFSCVPALRNRSFLRRDSDELQIAVRTLCCIAGVSVAFFSAYQRFASRMNAARATLSHPETVALAQCAVAGATKSGLDPEMLRRILYAEFSLRLDAAEDPAVLVAA